MSLILLRATEEHKCIESYVRDNGLTIAIGLDQPVRRASYRYCAERRCHQVHVLLGRANEQLEQRDQADAEATGCLERPIQAGPVCIPVARDAKNGCPWPGHSILSRTRVARSGIELADAEKPDFPGVTNPCMNFPVDSAGQESGLLLGPYVASKGRSRDRPRGGFSKCRSWGAGISTSCLSEIAGPKPISSLKYMRTPQQEVTSHLPAIALICRRHYTELLRRRSRDHGLGFIPGVHYRNLRVGFAAAGHRHNRSSGNGHR